jgi:hypothetical protein
MARTQHGTYAGYQKHIEVGTRPCRRCAAAQAAYYAEWLARGGEAQDRRKAYKAASHRAKTELARRHPGEYYQLLDVELTRDREQVAS